MEAALLGRGSLREGTSELVHHPRVGGDCRADICADRRRVDQMHPADASRGDAPHLGGSFSPFENA